MGGYESNATVSLGVEGSAAVVAVPLSVLRAFGGVVGFGAVTVVNPADLSESMTKGVQGLVSVTLFSKTGDRLNSSSFPEPVTVTLPAVVAAKEGYELMAPRWHQGTLAPRAFKKNQNRICGNTHK